MGVRSLRERGGRNLIKGDFSSRKIMDYVIRPIQRPGGGGGGGKGGGVATPNPPPPPLPVSAPDTRTCTLSYVYTRVCCSKFKWSNQQIVKTFKCDGDLVWGGGGGGAIVRTHRPPLAYAHAAPLALEERSLDVGVVVPRLSSISM